MAPIRYKVKPAIVANTYPQPFPSIPEPKNIPSPESSGPNTCSQLESLELPLRTTTDTVANNRHTNFTLI